MKILCIGDSNTYGYDPCSYIGSRYPAEVRWTDNLKGHDVINCGLNGMTVPRNHNRPVGLIRANEPEIVIVMLGTNDILSGLSAVQTAERMGGFLDSIMAEGRPVLLISPPVLQYGEWVMDDEQVEESQELGKEYRELAERKGCFFANAGEWGIDVTYDGVHFSAEGHRTFAKELGMILYEQKE